LAIRAAAVNFGLRNTFDSDEPQQVFVRTFQLQFGLCWNREAISEYQPPVIVAELTSPNSVNFSAEFRELWEALMKLRHRLISEQNFIERLQENPWIPEGGVDSLLAWARPPLSSGDQNQTQIFLRPRITDNGQLRLHLSTRLSDRLADDQYRLEIRNADASRTYELVRHYDNFRLFWAGVQQSFVQLPVREPIIAIRVSQHGRELFEEVIDVRPANGLFAIYSAAGVEQGEDSQIDLNGRYTILHASDVHIQPEYTWFGAFGGRWRIAVASGPFSKEFGVFAGAERLWPPEATSTDRPAVRWTAVARAANSAWGRTTEVHLEQHPTDLEPVTLTIGGVDFPVTAKVTPEAVKYISQVPVNPQLLHTEVDALLRCWGNGKAHSLRCFLLPGKHEGHLIERDGRWEALNLYRCDRSILNGRLRITSEYDDGLILAGARICGRIGTGIGRIDMERVPGLGEVLRYVRGVTTLVDGEVLSRAVYHPGQLDRADCGDGLIKLALRTEIEPTPRHRVLVWKASQELPFECAIVGSSGQAWHVEYRGGEVLAVGVFYADECLGSRFTGEASLTRLAILCAQTHDWPAMASALKAFRIPLLRDEFRGQVDSRFQRNPSTTLLAWLPTDQRLRDPGAEALIQEFTATFVPTNEQAYDVLTRLNLLTGNPVVDIPNGWQVPESLLWASPLFLAATAFWGLGELYHVCAARDLAPLCKKLAGQLAKRSTNLKGDASAELGGIDITVLEGLRRQAVSLVRDRGTPSAVLKIAARSPAFSAYAAVTLLEEWSVTLHN